MEETCHAGWPSEAGGTDTAETGPLVDAQSAVSTRPVRARASRRRAPSARVAGQVRRRHHTADVIGHQQATTTQRDVTQAADKTGCSDVTGMGQQSGHVSDSADIHERPSLRQQPATHDSNLLHDGARKRSHLAALSTHNTSK